MLLMRQSWLALFRVRLLPALSVPLILGCWPIQNMAANEVSKEQVARAKALFELRCQGAGEKIVRTVDDVEGVFLMKLRPDKINFGDQFAMDDPYGRDLSGEGYIHTFLRGSFPPVRNPKPGWPLRLGYLYVEAIDLKDGIRYRYTGSWKQVLVTSSILMGGDGKTQFYNKQFVLDKVRATEPLLRYGVTYEDISTREDREHWIAGSSLRVLDLQTNEVIAERIGYMWDPKQGDTTNFRSPWAYAANYACPDFHRFPGSSLKEPGASAQARQTQDFVEKILKPKLEQ